VTMQGRCILITTKDSSRYFYFIFVCY